MTDKSNNTNKEASDQFEATIVWQSDDELLPGRNYSLTCEDQQTFASITKLKYRVKTDGNKDAVSILIKGDTGVINLALGQTIEYDSNNLPAFELRDLQSKELLAKGQMHHSLRRATNIRWQSLDVNKSARAGIKGQKPCVVWFTGYSGSGKSTIANLVEKKLHDQVMHSYILDGDNVRHGLNKDLGFTDADRVENIRRIAETAKLMVDAGLIVLTSFISPFRSERRMARDLLERGEFIEVFLDTPLEICEQRDPKGLYKKVRAGQIKNFTGFDSPYEAPEQPELRIDTTQLTADQAAEQIVNYLRDQT